MTTIFREAEHLRSSISPESPYHLRRIALFLMELGVQVSADVMHRLTPEEFQQISGAIADLELTDLVGDDEAFRECQSMKAKGEAFARLGSDYALHFVREALTLEIGTV